MFFEPQRAQRPQRWRWICTAAAGGLVSGLSRRVPGGLSPSPPTPLPRFGGEGRILSFCCSVNRTGTPRPWKGRGDGGEGCINPAAALSVARAFQPEFCPAKAEREACFLNHREHRGHRGGRGFALQPRVGLSAGCRGVFQGGLPPHPRPLSPVSGARGAFCVCCSVNRTGTPRPWKGRGDGGEGCNTLLQPSP